MANDKPNLPQVRNPYYRAQDTMYEMREVLARETPHDLELRTLLHNVQDALYKFETELTKKYIWD